jgi:hypothetical protein
MVVFSVSITVHSMVHADLSNRIVCVDHFSQVTVPQAGFCLFEADRHYCIQHSVHWHQAGDDWCVSSSMAVLGEKRVEC